MKLYAQFLAIILALTVSCAFAQEAKTETDTVDPPASEEALEVETIDQSQESPATASAEQSTADESTPLPQVTPVGAAEIVKNVGTDGSFSYRVPINIPEYRGLQPNLALTYNSGNRRRGGSGAVTGIGWHISGLSMINRRSVGRGIPWFDDDRDIYHLDGMELLKCSSGNYPTDYVATETSASCSTGGDYVTLKENYQRIAYDSTENEFSVTHTNGTEYTYSALGTATGQSATPGTDDYKILFETTWVLTTIKDRQDNPNIVSIDYFVGANNGFAYRPNAITYASYETTPGSGVFTPGYRIKFEYDFPNEPMATFGTGTEVVAAQRYRLKSIQVRADGDKLRAYDLDYALSADTTASILETVTEYGDDFVEGNNGGISGGTALPNPYQFEYSTDDFETFEKTYPNLELNRELTAWDTDVDDFDELYFENQIQSYLDCDDHDEPNVAGYGLPLGAYKIGTNRSLQNITPAQNTFLHDWLSRKKTFAYPNEYFFTLGAITSFDPTTDANYGVFVKHSYRIDRDEPPLSLSLETHKGSDPNPAVHAIGIGIPLGNFSIVNTDAGPTSQLVNKSNMWGLTGGVFTGVSPSLSSGGKVGDVNSDGRTDSVYQGTNSSGWKIASIWNGQLDSQVISLAGTTPVGLPNNELKSWTIGDVNGDGASDFIGIFDSITSNDPRLVVGLSSGKTFIAQTNWWTSNNDPDIPENGGYTAIRDVNADGLGDLIVFAGFIDEPRCGQSVPQANPYTSKGAKVYLSEGDRFSPDALAFPQFVGMGDFDGDGLTDFVREGGFDYSPYPVVSAKINFGDGDGTGDTNSPNLLTKVTDALGGKTTVTYVPSSDSSVSTGDRIPGINYLVAEIERDGGNSASNPNNANSFSIPISYDGGEYDYDLRKPLGFGTITALLPSIGGETGRPSVETLYLNSNYAEAGLVDRRRTIFDGNIQDQTNNTWTITNTGNGPFRAQKTAVRSVMRYDADLIRTQEEFTYDIYGQVTLAVDQGLVDGSGTDLTEADDTARGFSYTRDTSNSTNYIMDRPKWERLYSGDSIPVDRTGWLEALWYYYDDHTGNNTAPDEGNLTLTEQWRGNVANNNARTELELAYDAYGNVTTSTNARGNDTTYTYDTLYNLFAETETNAINQVTSTTWDRACQKPTKIVDINSLDTDFTYDVFCREIEREIPGGQTFLTSYNNLGDPNAQYIETEQKSGSIDTSANYTRYRTRQYFDGLGQVYKSTMPAGNGNQANFIVTLNNYDNRGNLRWTSIPLDWEYVENNDNDASTNERTRFSYDPINRQIETLFADGSQATVEYLTENYAYYDNTTLTYPVVRTKDALCEGGNEHGTGCGQIDVLMDHRGNMIRETKYDFDRTDVNGSGSDERYTYFAYDLRNLLYSIEDMSGAIWCYGYDAYRNRTNILDPDLGGWLDTNTADCGEPAFTFGAGSWTLDYNANNFLSSQTDSVGNVVSYTYDDIDRVTKKDVDAVTGNDLRTEYSYDQRSVSNENEGFLTQLEIFSGTSTNYYHRIRYDYGENGQLARERHDMALPGTTARSYDIQNEYRPNYALERQFLPTTQHSGGNSAWSAHRFFYDAGDRLISVGTPTGNNWIESIDYNLWNNPTHMRFFSTVNDHHIDNQRDYDAQRGWLDEIRVADVDTSDPSNPTSTNKDRTIYARDDIGRVTKQTTDTVQQGAWYDYTYDNASRLLTATNFSSQSLDSWDRVFTYDRASRMRSKQDGTASATAYTYNANNRPAHAPRQIGGVTIDYDDNGNMEDSPSGRTMSYDGENRPVVVDNAGIKTAYTYGADGTRLLRAVGGDLTLTFANIEIRDYDTQRWRLVKYINPNIRIVGGDVSFLHFDQLDSVRLITDDAGNTLKRTLYKPFGSATDYNTSTDEDKTFLSQRFDEDAALQYLNARYYDPELALFITPDWLMPIEPGVGTNRFSYSMNDPVNLSDPGGNSAASIEEEERADERADERAERENSERIAGTLGSTGRGLKAIADTATRKALERKLAYARQRGVADAWKMERQAAIQGFPTSRDWSPNELRELIETGQVSGYVGDHIDTVSGSASKAADHRNIQFLTPPEHAKRHADAGGYSVEITGGQQIDRTFGGQLPDLATPAARNWPDTAQRYGLGALSGLGIMLETLDYADPFFGPIGVFSPTELGCGTIQC